MRLVAAVAAVALSVPGASAWTDPCEGASGKPGTGEPDQKVLTKILSKYVSDGQRLGIKSTLVDYKALHSDKADLETLRSYMAQVCHLDPALSPGEALATAINAYNAMMLSMVVTYNPPNSVREIPNVWALKFGTFNGSKVSLDDIEHGVIRAHGNGGLAAAFGARGRIHSGVNCASLSCPDLPFEAFEGSRLAEQLDAAVERWLMNPTKNPGLSGNSLVLSKIFDWYGGDFVKAAGSVQAFVQRHTGWKIPSGAAVSFVDYNWNLNEVNGTGYYSGAYGRSGVAAATAALGVATVAAPLVWV